MADVFGGLPVIYYDWDKGLDSNPDGVLIYLNGEYTLVKDVEFYDNLRGFIQTKTHFYMPETLKNK